MSENEWIKASKWNEHFQFPTKGTINGIVNKRKSNGAHDFLSRINSSFYINVKKFNDWMSKQKEDPAEAKVRSDRAVKAQIKRRANKEKNGKREG